ncbi:GNAT family N-acetyltransferase [Vulcaniibacterium tengchongense]|uniref:Ribosomal protein S18 acetylase RimI-like enzyme n=1 Tax=Vulcaniibacterium tengchongense TaxID=1273429 RepID=A0A3N4W9T2_9GAMM|nr:GNAT family N-acetyltransferase [Vulcaniibacterium tengchongense]RPE82024.1 ribosomal protein S18 acetylase RimI-like enzyme [Vulcaniibacterium tengchongense]
MAGAAAADETMQAALRERGLRLRPQRDDDAPFLRALYAGTREHELAGLDWPEPMRRTFLEQQFAAQAQHHRRHYPRAEFAVLERDGVAVGRRCLDRGHALGGGSGPDRRGDFLLIDISLLPAWRYQGIGTLLIRDGQRQAADLNRGLQLHVLRSNEGAYRLYLRLGFAVVADEGAYLRMRWA